MNSESDPRKEQALKIMLASDIHLGYKETDAERKDDSFNAFEEVLSLAVHNEVDLILLGGDLFHDNNPSLYSLDRCFKLLRRYCMGDKPIEIEFLSDQGASFKKTLEQTVNYDDPNMNISIPVFSIHGNHDDPSGLGNVSSLDVLSSSGLVNYFGNYEDATSIEIDPILFAKNDTKLAIYGISYIHDTRLCRLFDDGKVIINQPPDVDSWFNIFVVHQNRANRGLRNYLPEESLPTFVNLVIWGHEHDCRIEPEKNLKKGFFVSQPGSTVATSLAPGEALPKHCALLYIDKTEFFLQKIPLQTVRPFVFDTRNAADFIDDEDYLNEEEIGKRVQSRTKQRIAEMIEESKALITGHDKQPKLPLIRLRLEVTESCQMFHIVQFGQDYFDAVANPLDMIIFSKKFRKIKSEVELDADAIDGAYKAQNSDDATKVEDVIGKYFEEVTGDKALKVLSVSAIQEMTRKMVQNDVNDDDCRGKIIDFYLKKGVEFLGSTEKEDIAEKMSNFHLNNKETFDDLLKELGKRGNTVSPTLLADDDGNDNNDVDKAASSSVRGGRGRGRGKTTATKPSTSTRGKGRNTTVSAAASASKKVPLPIISSQKSSSRGTKRKVVYVDSEESDD